MPSKIEILKAINKAYDSNKLEDQEIIIYAFNKIIELEEKNNKYIKTYSVDKKTDRLISKHRS